MKELGAVLSNLNSPKILDVGTGGGNFIRLITSLYDGYKSIVGIDDLEIAVNTSKKNFNDERITFEKMNAYEMRFNDNTFDVVCISNSLHHLQHPERLFEEMERVLKEGGMIIINEMINDNLNTKQISHLKIHHFAAEIDRELGETHNETFSKSEILQIIEESSSLTTHNQWNLVLTEVNNDKEEEKSWLLQLIDRLVNRVSDVSRRAFYKEKGERIKEYVMQNGFESATQFLVVLK